MFTPKFYPRFFTLALSLISAPLGAAQYQLWVQHNDTIPVPLTQSAGDPEQGMNLIALKSKGNCLACHRLPISDAEFHGTIGPTLSGVGSRLTAAQLRLRIANEKQLNPLTIMPGYFSDPEKLNRVLDGYRGETILSAQEIEDIIAYLVTLK